MNASTHLLQELITMRSFVHIIENGHLRANDGTTHAHGV